MLLGFLWLFDFLLHFVYVHAVRCIEELHVIFRKKWTDLFKTFNEFNK